MLMLVLPLALPVLGHTAGIPESDTANTVGHGQHQDTPRDTHKDAPRDTPCPPLESGLEACCVVDGLPPSPQAPTTVPRVDRALALEISPLMAVPALDGPSNPRSRLAPHPWPVPSRIVFSTFLI